MNYITHQTSHVSKVKLIDLYFISSKVSFSAGFFFVCVCVRYEKKYHLCLIQGHYPLSESFGKVNNYLTVVFQQDQKA